MGFPVGYSDLIFPKLALQLILLLSFLRRLFSPDPPSPEPSPSSAILVRFGDLLQRQAKLSDACAVCLDQFECQEEVRCLTICRHVFHRGCLDRWMDRCRRTCPLCRALLTAEELQGSNY